ncbi:PcfB family protein [Lachnospiraceae bacterium MD308]|nr:PcfB family protein [Lachnospiraceae bacterium MD308]
MQDEVNEKTVSLCINGGKISARILKVAMLKALVRLEQEKHRGKQRLKEMKSGKESAVYHGKQSMEKLMKQNCQLSNIEVTDGNIKSFEKCARKYNIDFSLKKDTSISPPRYFVFFKAKDVDVMTAAFKEYTGQSLNKSKKPSIRKKLEQAKERTAKHREREKTKQKERGPEH